MEAFLTSTLAVALAEIGDKTQLLAVLLATQFRQPHKVIAGILVATVANHALAAFAGAQAAAFLSGSWFQLVIALSFIAMAVWTLVPDSIDDLERKPPRFGPFLTTTIAFFLVEMGDKTQVATIMMGARFHDVARVTAGSTLGMMIANVPAVLLGAQLLKRLPLALVRRLAAGLFALIGIVMLAGLVLAS